MMNAPTNDNGPQGNPKGAVVVTPHWSAVQLRNNRGDSTVSTAVSNTTQGILMTLDYAASLYGPHELDGYWISVTRVRREGGTQSAFVPADDPQAIADAVARFDDMPDTTGVFLSQTLAATAKPARFDPDKPGKHRYDAADAAVLTHVWVDLDIAGDGHAGKAYPPDEAAVRNILARVGLEPSHVRHTGHGWAAEWRLSEPWELRTDADRRQAAQLVEDFVNTVRFRAREAGLWVLDSVGDLARIMRVVGSHNRKGEHENLPVYVLEETGRVYEVDDLRAVLIESKFLAELTSSGSVTDEQQRNALALVNLNRAWIDAQRGAMREFVANARKFEIADDLTLVELWDKAADPLADHSSTDLGLGNSAFAAFRGEGDARGLHMAAVAIMENRIRLNAKTEKVDPSRRVDYMARTLARVLSGFERADRAPMTIREMEETVLTEQAEPEKLAEVVQLPVPAASSATAEKIDLARSKRWDYSHEGNASRFAAVIGTDTVAYVPNAGLTRTWHGSVWDTDTGTRLHELCKRVTNMMRIQCDAMIAKATEALAADKDDQEAKEAMKRALAFEKWVTKSRMGSDMKHFATAVRALPGLEVADGLWNRDPRLLNVANGTLELGHDGTVTFREHRAADRITQQTSTAYDPDATCPEWNAFLEWALPNPDVRRVFRAACSLSLIAGNFRHVFMFAIGKPRSGKTTAMEVVARVLDHDVNPAISYSGGFKVASLRSKKESGGSPDLIRMIDRRFLYASEPNDGWALSADVVKGLVGGDRQTIRDNYDRSKNMLDREPKFTPWIISNHCPEITGADNALFERVRAIPFDVVRAEHERDVTLKDRIAAVEASGVLNWLLAGFRDLAANPALLNRSEMPEECIKLAEKMRVSADIYARFLSECTEPCECGPEGCENCVTAADLWATFKRWADWSNEKAGSQRTFGDAVSTAGFDSFVKKVNGRNTRRRRGLRLNEEQGEAGALMAEL